MIWILLGVLVVLMTAPFVLSWYSTGRKKRTILDLPHDTSDMPFRHKMKPETDDTIKLDSLEAPVESRYDTPLFVEGKASFGEGSEVVACHARELMFSEKCRVASFADADEYLSIGKECELMGSAECGGDMDVADGSSFFDLFARRINFLGGASSAITDFSALKALKATQRLDKVEKNVRKVDDQEVIEKTIVTRHGLRVGKNAVIKGDVLSVIGIELDEGASIGGDIISHKAVTIGSKCNVLGDVSAEKDIELREGANILGNVISQKSIKLGIDSHVGGNLFAQDSVEIDDDVTIGTEGRMKSVIAGDTVSIHGRSTVYGRVRALRGGKASRNLQ